MLETGAHWEYVIAAWALAGLVLAALFARALIARAGLKRRHAELMALKDAQKTPRRRNDHE